MLVDALASELTIPIGDSEYRDIIFDNAVRAM